MANNGKLTNGAGRRKNGRSNGGFGDLTAADEKRIEIEAALCRNYIAAGMRPLDAVRKLAGIVDPAGTWQRKPRQRPVNGG